MNGFLKGAIVRMKGNISIMSFRKGNWRKKWLSQILRQFKIFNHAVNIN